MELKFLERTGNTKKKKRKKETGLSLEWQPFYQNINGKIVKYCHYIVMYVVEPRYNEVLGTMTITLLYQVSHYIRVKKQRNIKSWDQQNYLVIRGFCYIRPLYNEVPLYTFIGIPWD